MLNSEFRVWIPARIKQHEERPDVMSEANLQKLIDAFFEAIRILLPYQVVQEYAHRIHPEALRPTQFPVDLRRVEALRLPHLEFVDGICRNVVAANQPGLLLIPGLCLLLGPTRTLRKQVKRELSNDKDNQHPDCSVFFRGIASPETGMQLKIDE